jgi:hypothetical protein
MRGHVDKKWFLATVTGTWWNDLLFYGLGQPEHIWIALDVFSNRTVIVPEGTPGSFAATFARREEL